MAGEGGQRLLKNGLNRAIITNCIFSLTALISFEHAIKFVCMQGRSSWGHDHLFCCAVKVENSAMKQGNLEKSYIHSLYICMF